MFEEPTKGLFALLPLALVDIMRDILAQTIEHAFPVARVEGGVVAGQQGQGFGAVHRILQQDRFAGA